MDPRPAPGWVGRVRQINHQQMPDPVTIHDRAMVRDATGGTTQAWTPRAEQVYGKLSQVRDYEAAAMAGQMRGAAEAALNLPYGTDIAEGDRVHVAGTLWNVVGILIPSSAWATKARVLLREV